MPDPWPWIAIAGLGALHGLNPASGWVFAAAWGARSRARTDALRALIPIAVGHAASVGLVAGAVALGLALDRDAVQAVAIGLLGGLAIAHVARRRRVRPSPRSGHAALGLWSFTMASSHGAGLMLVPALMPLCIGDAAARDAGGPDSLAVAFAAVVVHTAAMIGVAGLVACAASASCQAAFRLLASPHRDSEEQCHDEYNCAFAPAGARRLLRRIARRGLRGIPLGHGLKRTA